MDSFVVKDEYAMERRTSHTLFGFGKEMWGGRVGTWDPFDQRTGVVSWFGREYLRLSGRFNTL